MPKMMLDTNCCLSSGYELMNGTITNMDNTTPTGIPNPSASLFRIFISSVFKVNKKIKKNEPNRDRQYSHCRSAKTDDID